MIVRLNFWTVKSVPKTKGKVMRRDVINVFLILSLFFIVGCATVSKPGNIPGINMGVVGKFSKALSVELINNQPDTTPRLYAGVVGQNFYANYNEWTKFFIDKLGEELKKRGATVSEDSPKKLKVKLGDFSYIEGWAKVRVNMKVSLEMPEKNWKKEWVASDVSGWSMGRAFGSVIYHAIEQILKDPEIIELLKVVE